jgi:hypothetical protein
MEIIEEQNNGTNGGKFAQKQMQLPFELLLTDTAPISAGK